MLLLDLSNFLSNFLFLILAIALRCTDGSISGAISTGTCTTSAPSVRCELRARRSAGRPWGGGGRRSRRAARGLKGVEGAARRSRYVEVHRRRDVEEEALGFARRLWQRQQLRQ